MLGCGSWLPQRLALAWVMAAVTALVAPAAAGAQAPGCPGAGDPCPYAGVLVVGEGGRGVFRFAQALALSPNAQRVYVGDVMGYRVQEFTRDGVFVRQWGRYGTGPGEIKAVGGLATDASGRVYVLDSNNDRVQVYNPTGDWLGAWGSHGAGPGQLDLGGNGGLAIDGDAAYVADQDNHRVQRFTLDPATGLADPDPSHVLSWGSFGDCATSCTPLNFNHPQGIAVSTVPEQPHDVFIADDRNHRVLKFSASGAPLGAIDAPGELGYPYDVGVDSTHALYVVDNCDPTFVPVCQYTTSTGRPDLTHQRVRKYDAGSLAFLGTWGVFGDFPGQFEFPRAAAAITADPAGGVYIAEAGNNRVQTFSATGQFLRQWGISGRGPGYFTRPAAVAADLAGNLYVADTGSDRIQELAPDGRYLGEWGRRSSTGYPAGGGGLGEFRDPAGIAVGADGTVYVADSGNDRVQARNPTTGAWRALTGVTLGGPRGLAVDSAGHLYVADTPANVVRVLNLATGQWSTVDGSFSAPRDVTVDAAGNLYVADTGADRVQIRDAQTGAWKLVGAGMLSRPAGVTLDAAGHLLVSDTGHDRVIRFNPQDAAETAWGVRGTSSGELVGPQGLTVDAHGRVIVTDEFNNRIQLFTPQPVSAPAPAPPARAAQAPGPAVASHAAARTQLTLSIATLGGRRALLRRGLRLRMTCSRSCLASVRVQLTPRDARRLGLSRSGRPFNVAQRTVRLARARPRLVLITVRRRATTLSGASPPPMHLIVSAVDSAGSRARTTRSLRR